MSEVSTASRRVRRRRAAVGDAVRRVLVTGASRGIGAAIATTLAGDGFDLALGYVEAKDRAEALALEIAGESGRDITLVGFDIADRALAAEVLGADIAEHGAYWGVVLNAGVNQDAVFPALSEQAWDRVLRTNLDGFYNVLHPAVMPMIRARRGGRIVTLSSLAGITGNRGQVNYAASKAGIIGATKSLALELAKREITVNCVAPGWIDTEMLGDVDREALAGLVPMERLGKPEEVSSVVGFLFSQGASYVTGQVISVNGGVL